MSESSSPLIAAESCLYVIKYLSILKP